MADREVLTWELFGTASRELATEIAKDGFEPRSNNYSPTACACSDQITLTPSPHEAISSGATSTSLGALHWSNEDLPQSPASSSHCEPATT